MDADYVVLGSYDFDGSTFVASAQLLDMQKLHLGPLVESKGPLTDLIKLQTALAYSLLVQLPNPPAVSREQFLQTSAPIRLDAFEAYIRGTLATNRQQKIRYFHDAIRLNPTYTLAMLRLGKAYYDNHEYELASSWFVRVPKNDAVAGEAAFLLGMSEFYRAAYDKSFAAFNGLVGRLPLTEVYNNLGVVESRRGKRTAAIEYFSKATNADPNDADYRFNLAVALYKNGDTAGAARQLKEELQRRPADGEAKSLLDAINRGIPPPSTFTTMPNTAAGAGNAMFPSTQVKLPMERIKRNYDEASYRQLEMEIHNLTEERLAQTDSLSHSAYHVERGKQLAAQNIPAESESEFREAIAADYNNAAAHAGLAGVLEKKGDVSGARTEAQTSIRISPNVDAYLVLARVLLKQNQLLPATEAVSKALQLEPASQAAIGVKQALDAKQAAAK
jgi:tetratricopeptide (TPR) repeat protein